MHPESVRHGEAHDKAKLTTVQVLEVLRLHRQDGLGKRTLGRMFGVNPSSLQGILQGKTWKHIARET